MRKLLYIIPLLIFQACDIINPPEDIPAYLHASQYEVNTISTSEGTASANVADIWVYAGNDFIGAYELPTTFPVLKTGNTEIRVLAGVKENGISIPRVPYPFYNAYKTQVTLGPNQTDTIKPVFSYSPQTKFEWIANFDGSDFGVVESQKSQSGFHVTTHPDSVFEGSGSLVASISDSKTLFEIQSKDAFVLPRGKAVWLELNCKTEVKIEVGVFSISSARILQKMVAGANPSSDWNKIYFNLTEAVSAETADCIFGIYINSQNVAGEQTGKIMLDNIKLLSFE